MSTSWAMILDPLGNPLLSGLWAMTPILFLFGALLFLKMKISYASGGAILISLLIANLLFSMPLSKAIFSVFYGILFGLFPISYIILGALYFYNLSCVSGNFNIIKGSFAYLTEDRRIQALLIAFCLGSFLEAASGFGTPVAITAAMLTGLGFDFKRAAGLALIANTAAVAFGALGIPVIVGAKVSGVELTALTQMVGRQLAPFSLLLPFYLVSILVGFRQTLSIWPILVASGLSYALTKLLVSNYLGPYLPGILASIASLTCTLIALKIWKPQALSSESFSSGQRAITEIRPDKARIIKAWIPFGILSLFIILWGTKGVKTFLDALFSLSFPFPHLHHEILRPDGMPQEVLYHLNILSSPGTAVLLAALISVPIQGISFSEALKTFLKTVRDLKDPIITISLILGFSHLMNFSGLAITLGSLIAYAGPLFPLLSAFLGWLGVFITGSDTSSNALFGKLQETAAKECGFSPVLAVATNTNGGVMGKMISPQSIAIATAATGAKGREHELLRFTFKHSLLLTLMVGLLAMVIAHYLPMIIPG